MAASGLQAAAVAQTPPGQSSPVQSSPTAGANPPASSKFLSELSSSSNLLGGIGGLRPWLGARGVTLSISETSEMLANVTGGVHTGPAYEGVTLLGLGLDTEKAFGWRGGIINATAEWIHGRNLSSDNLLNLQTASGIEASPSLRLWELWMDQALFGGAVDLKLGQQSLDQEFITSTYTTLFINTVMGWPGVPSYDMYAGGPAYPLSSLGVRLRGSRGPVTGLIGVFDDNPPGGRFNDDSQRRGAERSGLAFNLNAGALVIGELQLAVNMASARASPRPGTFRAGAWFDSAAFPDQRFDGAGRSLADPASDGTNRLLRHNFGLYFSGDQLLWKAADRELGIFLRMEGAPADRNLLSFSTNLGLSLKAPFHFRPNDSLGIAYGLAKVSGRASALDQDASRFAGNAGGPVRSSESVIEVTYQAQIVPWWNVQPNIQYIWTPEGGIANPDAPDGAGAPRLGNEAILGVRTNVVF